MLDQITYISHIYIIYITYIIYTHITYISHIYIICVYITYISTIYNPSQLQKMEKVSTGNLINDVVVTTCSAKQALDLLGRSLHKLCKYLATRLYP